MYRVFSKGNQCYKQLVVPKCLRETVLKMGHDMPMAGHLGRRRTLNRIQQDFYWPDINRDVRTYYRTCDACQRTIPKGKLTRVPVGIIPLTDEESWEDVSLGSGLNRDQRDQARQLTAEFSDVRCNLGECTLELSSGTPVRVRPYPLPHFQTEVVRKEVQAMLNMGVIEKTSSPSSAPIVFDSEPMPDVEQLFANVGKSCFITKLDLTKGYRQIPMAPGHQKFTAFSTPQGQCQWKTMPFGIKTAGAVFSLIMRALLDKGGGFANSTPTSTADYLSRAH